jgi:competence protein ComEA
MDDVAAFSVSTRRIVAAALGIVALVVVAERHFAGAGTATTTSPPAPLTRAAPSTRPRVVVHVVGAVRRPGLYRLADGSRIADAVRRAGGATAKAELELVNLAAPLADGAQVVVPRHADPAPAESPASPDAPGAPGAKVSLNRASAEELDALPGVGPTTAQKILAYRQEHGAIGSVDELDAIPGIGPARLEQLRDVVTP